MSPMSSMSSMALVLSVLWTASAAEGPDPSDPSNPSDPSCVLQMMAGQNLASGLQHGQPAGWSEVCKSCYCTDTLLSQATASLEACIQYCESQTPALPQVQSFTVVSFHTEDQNNCGCCANNVYTEFQTTTPRNVYEKTSSAAVTGDPHLKTLDGRSYTLLSQGTFLLWRLSGMETELQSAGGVKKTVDWHLYAHYSGHQSFTKGLLLVDMFGGSVQQVLEITAQKCEWRTRKAHQAWTAVNSSPSDLISVDAEGNDVTTFNLVTTNGAKFHNQLRMNVKTKDGKTGIAVLRLSCRPNHNLNLHITMSRRRELSLLSRYQVFECILLFSLGVLPASV